MDEESEALSVRQGVLEPSQAFDPRGTKRDTGAMVTVVQDGGLGYAGTTDLSATGIARRCGARGPGRRAPRGAASPTTPTSCAGEGRASTSRRSRSRGTTRRPPRDRAPARRVRATEVRRPRRRLVDAPRPRTQREAGLIDTRGADIHQHFEMVIPGMGVTAFDGRSPRVAPSSVTVPPDRAGWKCSRTWGSSRPRPGSPRRRSSSCSRRTARTGP